jgi:tetratricopeptide (TPR) repeat protein
MKRASMITLIACTSSVAAQPSDDRQQAKSLYDEGSSEYREGHYDRAIELFQQAYARAHAPGLLFNIAQAYRLKGASFCTQALDYYRRTLAEDPSADNRVEIEERIGEMETCVRRATPTEPARPAPEPVTEPTTQRRYAPLITAGAGAAVAITGGIIYWRARVKFDEVEPTCPCPPGTFSGWETATNASYVMMGVGTLAFAGGLIWSSIAPGPNNRVGIVPTLGGIQYTAAF